MLRFPQGFGQAQPSQPQSQGTPYNPQQGQPFGAWSPQQPPASRGQPIHGQQGGSQFPMPQPSQAGPPGWSPQPGSQAVPGPVPGTTMFRPPMNQPQGWEPHHFLPRPGEMLAPSQVPQPGGGRPVSQPGQRTPITQGPGQRPGGAYSPMPAGTPQSLLPFFEQAQQFFPAMNPFQQREAAHQIRNQQESQQRQMMEAVRAQGMNQWQADQAAAGQGIKDIGPGYRTNAKNRRR
jgi:hypothetical protein